jgi:hypothetical protein
MFDYENSAFINKVMELVVIHWMATEIIDHYTSHPKIIEFMQTKQKFDVCVFEVFNFDALLGIVDHVDCVLVSYTTCATVKWTDDMTGK